MKSSLQFIETNKWLLLSIIVIIAAFYWYEWRPSQIEKECSAEVIKILREAKSSGSESSDRFLNLCISSGGLNNMRTTNN